MPLSWVGRAPRGAAAEWGTGLVRLLSNYALDERPLLHDHFCSLRQGDVAEFVPARIAEIVDRDVVGLQVLLQGPRLAGRHDRIVSPLDDEGRRALWRDGEEG